MKIDLEMADGQGGALLDEADGKEEDPGVFTVANKNDTDGDAIVDSSDSDVSGGDIDLMEMKVNRFNPYDAQDDGEKMVTLDVPANATLYKSKDKKSGIESTRAWKAKDLDQPKTFWVELKEASASVRSDVFTLTGGGATDTVKATGVWAEKTGVKANLADTLWTDTQDPMKSNFNTTIQKFGKNFFNPLVVFIMLLVSNLQ